MVELYSNSELFFAFFFPHYNSLKIALLGVIPILDNF